MRESTWYKVYFYEICPITFYQRLPFLFKGPRTQRLGTFPFSSPIRRAPISQRAISFGAQRVRDAASIIILPVEFVVLAFEKMDNIGDFLRRGIAQNSDTAFRVTARGIVVVASACAIFLASVVTYVTFVRVYMPEISHTVNLNFIFA